MFGRTPTPDQVAAAEPNTGADNGLADGEATDGTRASGAIPMFRGANSADGHPSASLPVARGATGGGAAANRSAVS
jgi:hypothetical protein